MRGRPASIRGHAPLTKPTNPSLHLGFVSFVGARPALVLRPRAGGDAGGEQYRGIGYEARNRRSRTRPPAPPSARMVRCMRSAQSEVERGKRRCARCLACVVPAAPAAAYPLAVLYPASSANSVPGRIAWPDMWRKNPRGHALQARRSTAQRALPATWRDVDRPPYAGGQSSIIEKFPQTKSMNTS